MLDTLVKIGKWQSQGKSEHPESQVRVVAHLVGEG